jgi:hypothetical protein
MAIAVIQLKAHLVSAAGKPPGVLELLALMLAGMVVYPTTALLLWMLAGRPTGAEHQLLSIIQRRRSA